MNTAGPFDEVESLRSQVADLARELAKRDHAMQDLREQSQPLGTVLERTGPETGHEFFVSLVTHLTTTLKVQYALLGAVTGTESVTIRTLAVSAGGQLVDNFEYGLAHTPCEKIFEKTVACYEQRVQEQFPRFARLAELEVEGYCGVPLRTTAGRVVGILAIMDTKPLENTERLKSLMAVLAPRAEAELQRQQAEAALRESQERFHLAMQGSQTGIWDWELLTNQVYFSPIWKQQLGYGDHELPGHLDDWRSRLHPDDRDRALAAVQACLDGQTSHYELEHRLRHRDGAYRWILARGASIRDQHGTPYRMAGSHLDITERKRKEDALREREERFRGFLDHAPHLAFLKATDGTYLYVNRQFETALGVSRDQVLGKTDRDLFPQQQAELFQRHDRQVLEQNRPGEFEEVAEQDDGPHINIVAKFPPRDAAGRIVSIGGIATDITDRKKAEKALHQSEERFRRIFEGAGIGMVLVDMTGRILHVNRSYSELLGYSHDELTSMTFIDITHPDDLDSNLALFTQAQQGTLPMYQMEKRYLHKNGQLVWISMVMSVMSNSQGGPEYVIVQAQDITKRKRAEHKLSLTQFTVDHAMDAIYWIDPQAKIVDVNEAAGAMLGYTKEVLCTMTVHDLNPDFQAAMWPAFWAETQQRGITVFETTHRTKDGRMIPVEVHVNFLTYEGQEFHCAFVRNITNRKAAEEELRRSKARLTAILENTPAVVYTRQVGNGWPFTFMTPNVYALLGYTSADIVGDPDRLDGLIHPNDDRGMVHKGVAQLLRDGAHTFAYRLRHRDGSYRWIENRARLTDDEGGPRQIIGTMLDITDRKQAEKSLSQREQDLRTALDERKRISQDLHDGILQSLYAVGLGLESCKSPMHQRKYKKAAALLAQAVEQLNDLMSEIRNVIAGLEFGVLSGNTFSVAVHELAETVTATRPIQCTVSLDESVAGRLATEHAWHLLNIVREALSNSLRHGQATKATVSLKQLAHSIRLCLSDNGRGFDPAAMRGVGHGLANMAARVKKIGGRFAVRSAHQSGTRIIIDLPEKEGYADIENTAGSVAPRR